LYDEPRVREGTIQALDLCLPNPFLTILIKYL
jgi:hypothetical protein